MRNIAVLALMIFSATASAESSTLYKMFGGKKDATEYPASSAGYKQVNSQVGCDSKYSDNKKEDIFNSQYKDHWMTWSGVVVLADSDNASLNIDGVGTQDLQVDFKDKKAGYDLQVEDRIKVKFLMSSAGGCFLPFTGEEAEIIK